MAVIDAGKHRIVQLYRDKVETDSSIRINSGSLRLDTARYNLAPGVRALGVRMSIGHSPRCAEGSESDYLTLFIEVGAKLRPVLKNMAMSAWSLIEGLPCNNGEGASVNDNIQRSIVVLPSVTEGWHDLQVMVQHTIYKDDEKPVKHTETGPTLRAKGKQYPIR